MELVIVSIGGFFVLLALASGVLQGRPVSTAMLAVAAGVLFGPLLGITPSELDSEGVLVLAELTLAVVLFVDATRVDLRLVRRSNGEVPARMLLIGLPLVVGAGTLAGMGVLGLGAPAAFVLACVLAPTDAALGQAVMVDQRVPVRVRQALNVESGLNDGLAVPLLTTALVVAEATEGSVGGGSLVLEGVRLIGVGALVGVAAGGGIGLALRRIDWRTLQPVLRQVGVAAVPFVAWAAAGLLGGNGFVAAFVAGVAFGAVLADAHELVEFAEDTGQLLALLTFIVFGALFLGPAVEEVGVGVGVYVVLQLTLVRMVPISVSLVGVGLRPRTVAMLGWFGPRGLATVVFGLQVLELTETGVYPPGEQLFGIAALVVVASVVAHGASAAPLVSRYADWLDRDGPRRDQVPQPPEWVDVSRLPLRSMGQRDAPTGPGR